MKQIIEKKREYKPETHLAFIDMYIIDMLQKILERRGFKFVYSNQELMRQHGCRIIVNVNSVADNDVVFHLHFNMIYLVDDENLMTVDDDNERLMMNQMMFDL